MVFFLDAYSLMEYFSDIFYDSFDFVLSTFRTVLGFSLFQLTLFLPIAFIGYVIRYLYSRIREHVNKIKNGKAGT